MDDKIIEKCRLVTFRGTEEVVKKQEGISQSFGVINQGCDKTKFCEVEIEDLSSIDFEKMVPQNLQGGYREKDFRCLPLKFAYEDGQWFMRLYNLDTNQIMRVPMDEIIWT